ncbi:hypothetical protein CYMTET_28338, partial [Cymbomonas tetramitiformis]
KKAGVEPNVITYNSLISACEKGGQWEKALEVFAGMKKAGVEPNVITYSSLISACEKGGQWEKALEVFAGMKKAGVEPDVITYNSLISACEKGGQWEKALEVFAGMKKAGVEPDVITYSSLISACEKGGQWEKALEVFAGMKKAGVEPDVITYSSLISACEKGGQWEKALEVFAGMKKAGVEPDVITCNVLLNALWGDRQYANAIFFVEKVFTGDNLPSGCSISGNLSVLDLHGTSPGSAKCLTLVWLSAVEESFNKNQTSRPPDKIKIVTGWGKHSDAYGKSEVKDGVESILDSLSSPFRVPEQNPGILVAPAHEVLRWFAQLRQKACLEDVRFHECAVHVLQMPPERGASFWQDDPNAHTPDVEASVGPAMFHQAADLDKLSVANLRCLAKQLGCKGYSKLRKSALVTLIMLETADNPIALP